jgi:GT2 family glycosyltransferase
MLSVLIVNWNTRDLLDACLRSISLHPPHDDYEVIVVDNASRDGSAEMVLSDHPEVTLIRNSVNTGYAKGNNLAFARASGEWLLTLNPDTEVHDGTLQQALDTLRAHSGHGVLAPRLRGPDGRVQHSIRGFPTLAGIFGDMTGIGRIFPSSAFGTYRLTGFDYDRLGDAPQPMGTFLLFRRESLEAVGDPKKPFDEEFPIFFNEVDLLLRLARAGWPCLYTPDVEVLHHGGESTRQVRKSMIWESHRSLVRFLRKHRRTRWNGWVLGAVSVAVYAAAFVRARGFHAGFGA